MIKLNKYNWSIPLMIVMCCLIVHLFIILYSLYKTFIGFDIYPSIGLLTYSMLSIGMYVSVFQLIKNKNKFSTPILVLSIVASIFVFSDLFVPGILLSTWRYTSSVAISICFFALMDGIGNRKNLLSSLTYWIVGLTWSVLSAVLILSLSSSLVFGGVAFLLAVSSILLIIHAAFNKTSALR